MTQNNKAEIEELYELVASIKSAAECRELFEDLCTYKEINSMAQRLRAAKLLTEGVTYEQIIEGLVAEGPAETECLYAFEFGEPYTFFGVAKDKDGNYTEVWSSKETTFTKAGCSPAEEFFTTAASTNNSKQHNTKPTTSSMLSVE